MQLKCRGPFPFRLSAGGCLRSAPLAPLREGFPFFLALGLLAGVRFVDSLFFRNLDGGGFFTGAKREGGARPICSSHVASLPLPLPALPPHM